MSDQTSAVRTIEEHRVQIDALDEQIVGLLNARADEALAIRALKPQAKMGLFDPKREEEIFEKIEGFNKGPLFGEDLRSVYATILRVMKEMHA
ncbi:MAG: chorismate mutase [Coriobacteriales bacterium]|jgi:chorismate mutase|nr:chorismate mutase [Coriobacteriales bacterium]